MPCDCRAAIRPGRLGQRLREARTSSLYQLGIMLSRSSLRAVYNWFMMSSLSRSSSAVGPLSRGALQVRRRQSHQHSASCREGAPGFSPSTDFHTLLTAWP